MTVLDKGSLVTVIGVTEANGGRIVETDQAKFGILRGPAIAIGDRMEIGTLCGDWCFLFVKGERLRAHVLS